MVKHMKNGEDFDTRFKKMTDLEHLNLEQIYSNFWKEIQEAEKSSLPDYSHFSDENRKRMQLLKYLNMYNELQHYYNQEAEGKFQFKIVTYDDVLASIDRVESKAQTIIDMQFV